MNLAGFLLLASLTGLPDSADLQDTWIPDGARLCTFDATIVKSPTRCVQYHKVVAHKLKNGQVWNEYRWMWKDRNFEVEYTSHIGLLGVSQFTIGEVAYRSVGSSKYTKSQAVSFAASREELLIGIPGDGYQFAMKGAV